MIRYWVVAPYDADVPEVWERVWQFDLSNEVISIGWQELGDFSSLSENELRAAMQRAYDGKTHSFNMLWNFYHSIQVDDIVIARKGLKKIAGVGTVIKPAYYSRDKNVGASGPDHTHSNYLGVRWHDIPRDKEFDHIVFHRHTIWEITESKYQELMSETSEEVTVSVKDVKNPTEFVLEKYLEDFIISNFAAIFRDELVLYKDPEGVVGQQYITNDAGRIDILAHEPSTNSFVVIELKKGRESDTVIGQTLRYMGWVSDNLCQDGQTVKGIIICKDSTPHLSYALKMVSNITVKYYSVDFKLSDAPVST